MSVTLSTAQIKSLLPFISRDDLRPMSALFCTNGYLVATDGHKLVSIARSSGFNRDVSIRRTDLEHVAKLAGAGGSVDFALEGDAIVATITGRVTKGSQTSPIRYAFTPFSMPFPPWHHLIPGVGTTSETTSGVAFNADYIGACGPVAAAFSETGATQAIRLLGCNDPLDPILLDTLGGAVRFVVAPMRI